MKILIQSLILSIILSFYCASAIEDSAEGIAAVFTDEQQEVISSGEQQEFQAEVNRLMEIIVNSLYKTRDIFLRELVSNANDAIDKIRMKSLLDKQALGDTKELTIKVQVDPDAGTLTILDTGIGMSAADLVENLGTIAHSGTASFLDEAFAAAADSGADSTNLIGQFGVGFYSAFLVSDVVTVISKANDDPIQHIWTSTADGNFRISEDPRGNTLGRGTAVILKIKEDAQQFLDTDVIESTIKRYSQFIQYPINLYDSRIETEEIDIEVEDREPSDDDDDDELSIGDDDADDEPTTKTIEHTIYFWKQINENKPIWARRKAEISDDEYVSFYKALTNDDDEPLSHTHFKAEGEIEFDSVLYIPQKAPQGMYDQYYNSKSALKLYVRRVLVADQFEDIIPRYLNFVKGLVDSNDLPLNVNREDLQKSKIMTIISRKLTRKALDMLRKLARDEEPDEDDDDVDADDDDKPVTEKKYSMFWNEFGKSIKLGLLEDNRNKKRLMELLRFPSSKTTGDDVVSLNTYVNTMPAGQKHIYYISGSSREEVEASPFMERLRKRDWEVLYFIDNLDEYLNLQDYEDYQFQAITKEGTEFDGQRMQDFLAEKDTEFEDLKTWLKEVYGSRISKVVISSTLQESAMAIGTTKWGYSAHMERLTKSQAFGAGGMGMKATKVLQINYRHPIIINLKEKVEDGDAEDNDALADYANLLLDVAFINSGFDIEQETQGPMLARVERILKNGLDIPLDTPLEPEPEFADEIDEDIDEDDDDDDDDEDDDDVDDDGDLVDDDEDKEEL